MQAKVSWQQKMHFVGLGDSGHEVHLDAKKEIGGEDLGARPMELLLMGLGGCTGIDIVMILDKMRIAYDRVDVLLDAKRAPNPPEKFTEITLTYEIDAIDADVDKVIRAVKLSQEKYCSASHSLSATLSAVVVVNGQKVYDDRANLNE